MDSVQSIPGSRQKGEGIGQRKIVGIDVITRSRKISSTYNTDSDIGYIVDGAATVGPAGGIPRQHRQRILTRQRHRLDADVQPQQLGKPAIATGFVR